MARSRQRGSTRPLQTAKPRTDIYTGLLVVSLLAQIAGAVFLYFDYDRFKLGNGPSTSAPPIVKSDLPPANQPAQGPPVQPVQ